MGKHLIITILGTLFSHFLVAQERVVHIPFGDFNQWITRNIRESKALGGNTIPVYAIGPQQTIDGSRAYDKGDSRWGTSNVIASVMGLTKISTTVFPEKRDNGYCARMETTLSKIKVLGIVNFSLVISGSLYLGSAKEPIVEIDKPHDQIDMGIPFTEKPIALELDYKTKLREDNVITKSSLLEIKQLKGVDPAEVCVLLQRRWEDKRGNLFARRVGTAVRQFDRNTEQWVNNCRIPFHYGDFSQSEIFQSYMKLRTDYGAKNSRGRIVSIQEVGWADSSEEPTHMILMIQSGSLGVYVGALDNTFWVDNVKLIY